MRFLSLRASRRLPFWILPLLVGVVVMLLPVLGAPRGTLRMMVTIALLSMLVVGLNIAFGYAGELALG